MRETERTRVGAQFGKTREQGGIGGAREQQGKQRIFLCARGIDLVESAGRRRLLAVKIRPQDCAAHASGLFHGKHAFRGDARPVGDGRLQYADAAREPANSAGSAIASSSPWSRIGRFSSLLLFKVMPAGGIDQ